MAAASLFPINRRLSTMPAPIGHNSNDLTPRQYRALYMEHFNAILRQTEVCKAENAARLELRKRAKADGIILGDIDFGMRCAQIEDPQVITDEKRRQLEIMRFFALPIGAQVELALDREPIVERAAREGEYAGYAAKDRDSNPYEVNSEPGRAWAAAWDDAQAQMLEDLRQAMEIRRAKREAAAANPAAGDDGENDPPNEDGDE